MVWVRAVPSFAIEDSRAYIVLEFGRIALSRVFRRELLRERDYIGLHILTLCLVVCFGFEAVEDAGGDGVVFGEEFEGRI